MEIYGNEYSFRFTVGAMLEIAQLCPEGKVEKLDALLSGSDATALETTCKMAVALSKAHDLAYRFERGGNIDAKPPLTMEMLSSLDCNRLLELKDELSKVLRADGKPTVEVETAKKKRESAAPKSG